MRGLLGGIAFAMACPLAIAQQDGPGKIDESLAKRFNLVPKYFQPTESGKVGTLGFSYEVDETLLPISKDSVSQVETLKLDFKATGNVAFNASANPADFLKTGLDLNYTHSFREDLTLDFPGSGCNPLDASTAARCREAAFNSPTGAGLALIGGLAASLESDQKFAKRAWTYGARMVANYRPAPGSMVNKLNVLDWPFRLLRSASRHPMGSYASPDAFPTLNVGLERVMPEEDPDRKAVLGEDEHYNRANVELAMSTPMGLWEGKAVKFDISWRYFKELSPDSRIRAARLDRFRYTAASIKLDAGWRLTYATGRLPFNRQDESAWSLGYEFKFDKPGK